MHIMAQVPNYIWAKSSQGSKSEIGMQCAADASGNVIVIGYFESPTITFDTTVLTNADTTGNTADMYLVKYDPAGNVLWATSAGGLYDDIGYSCTTDNNGNIIATGYFNSPIIIFGATVLTNFNNTGVTSDLYIVKYDAGGNALWAASAGGFYNDCGFACSADFNGNIVLTGCFYGANITFGTTVLSGAGIFDVFLVKYNSTGNLLWAKAFGESDREIARSVTHDVNGNIILNGDFESPTITFGTTVLTNANPGNEDIFTTKFDSGGNVLWATSAGELYSERVNHCCTDSSGNIIVTGYFDSYTLTFDTIVLTNAVSIGFSEMFVVKYDPNGNVLWANSTYGIYSEYGFGCAADANGNIIVTGVFSSPSITFGTTVLGPPTGADVFFVKYDATGNVLWAISAGGANNEASYSCATDAAGNIFATGYFQSPIVTFGSTILNNSGNLDLFVVKINELTGLPEIDSRGEFSIFPNPTSEYVILHFKNTLRKADVTIIDISGKIIYSTTISNRQGITINTKDFAEGMYLVQTKSATFTDTQKLIVSHFKE